MLENPFLITERIIPEYFCDRQKESAEMIKMLKNGNNVVLISQRRIGKTALIQYCYEKKEIKDEFLTVYVDILSTSNLKEFTFLLGKEIFDTLRTKGRKRWMSFLQVVSSIAGKIGIDPLTGLPTFNLQLGDIAQPEYTLKELFNFVDKSEKPCIIAIDEFQQITKYPEKNIEALLRSHILQINNCRMIFSGSERHLLSNMFVNSSRPFYHSASLMELVVIPKDIYVSFIMKMFEAKEKRISLDRASHIYDLFEGVTFYVQRVCNGIFGNTEPKAEVTDEIIRITLDEILTSYDIIYRMRLSQLTIRQKELLFAIANEKIVEKITSSDFIKKYSLSSASAVQTSLKSLLKDEIIVKTGNGYKVEDSFFQIWLKEKY